MRILVTASRAVVPDDRPQLEQALREVIGDAPGPHTLVQGDALGGDQVFASIARDWGWIVEAHPADWYAPCRDTCKPGHRRTSHASGEPYCPAAGIYRNEDKLVGGGADAAVAAYKRGAANKGTTHCAQAAGRAGIPVKRVVV